MSSSTASRKRRLKSTVTTLSYAHNEAAQIMQHILYRVRQMNRIPNKSNLIDFSVDGHVLGMVTRSNAELLCGTTITQSPFVLFEDKNMLSLDNSIAGTTSDSRTAAIATVMEQLHTNGIIHGWRNELYPMTTSFYKEPVFCMERAAVPLLGGVEYGVHVNGLVVDDQTGEVRMWMARRSADKAKYPGMLDHIVAGGQPVGMSLQENVFKECSEEAGIPEELVVQARPAGACSYATYSQKRGTLSRGVLFNFDLILPPDFVPKPVDGEVQEFFLWGIDEVLASMAPDNPDPIKPNCYLVIIDYLLRAGFLSPDVPGYLDVLRELRNENCR